MGRLLITSVRYDAILFDMDGVLISGTETAPTVYRKATAHLLEAFGLDPRVEKWTMALENPTNAAEFREACRDFGIPADAAWGYRERTATEIARRRMQRGKRQPYADTAVLDPLSEEVEIGICSNNRYATVRDCIEQFGWVDLVASFRGRYPTLRDYDRMKPNPSFLSAVIDDLDVTSPLFVGDRVTDLQTAERVGCDAALLTRDGNALEGQAEPTFHLETLSSLPTILTRS